MTNEPVDLTVSVGKITLKNPVMPSSGTFGYGTEYADLLNLDDLGAVIVKGTTLHPRLGSFQYRCTEYAGSSSIFTIGLQNVGVQRFITDKLPLLRKFKTPVIVNIAGESVDEFAELADILNKAEGVAGIEINLACPNVHSGGAQFSADVNATFKVVKAVKNATDLTAIAKISPTVTDVTVLAKACEEAGADAICPNYGVMGMAIDIRTRRSKLGGNLLAALGGPWIKPVSIKMVWQAAQAVKIPIIGGGGIMCADDAIEFIIAGAAAVQIGICNFVHPGIQPKIVNGIKDYLLQNRIKNIGELRGTFIRP
jgi:dihydroorotate dehydrogenase (NAD+) catalytic subunit